MLIKLNQSLVRLNQVNCNLLPLGSRSFSHLISNNLYNQSILSCHYVQCKHLQNSDSQKKLASVNRFNCLTLPQQSRCVSSLAGKFVAFSEFVGHSYPVKTCTEALIWVHDTTGLPWWSTIIISTFLFRTLIVFPFMCYDRRIIHKLINITPQLNDHLEKVGKQLKQMVDRGELSKKKFRINMLRAYKKKSTEVYIANNVHPGQRAILILFQFPLWMTMSSSLSNLCFRPHFLPDPTVHDQFFNQGFLWFENLIQPDPYYILPTAFFFSIFSSLKFIELLKKHNQPIDFKESKFEKGLMIFFKLWTVLLVGLSTSMPSGIVLYWATSAVCGTLHHYCLSYPKVRRVFRIPEISKEPKPLGWTNFVELLKKNKF